MLLLNSPTPIFRNRSIKLLFSKLYSTPLWLRKFWHYAFWIWLTMDLSAFTYINSFVTIGSRDEYRYRSKHKDYLVLLGIYCDDLNDEILIAYFSNSNCIFFSTNRDYPVQDLRGQVFRSSLWGENHVRIFNFQILFL